MTKYFIVVEETKRNFSAYCPNLPGCVATGENVREVVKNMKEAIEFHREGLREDGKKPPKKTAQIKEVLVK